MSKPNLHNVLQGLIDTDRGIILKIRSRVEELMNEIKSSIDDLVEYVNQMQKDVDTKFEQVDEKIDRGANIYGILDIDSPNIVSDGSITTDINASKGSCYSVVSSSSATRCLYSSEFASVNYGFYAVCMRLKLSTTTTSSIVKLKIYNGSSVILEKDFSGSLFTSANKYQNVYTTFNYDGNDSEKGNLKIEVQTLNVEGITVSYDYAYISIIMPAVFI